jgi:hypothetical protein
MLEIVYSFWQDWQKSAESNPGGTIFMVYARDEI